MALEGIRRSDRLVASATRSNLAWAHIERRLDRRVSALHCSQLFPPSLGSSRRTFFVLDECAHSVGKMAPRAPKFVRHNNRVKLSGEYFQSSEIAVYSDSAQAFHCISAA